MTITKTNSCRTLAEKMGGTVGFVDNAPHGTVMTLRVPTRLEPLPAAQQQCQQQQLQVYQDDAARRVTSATAAATAGTAAAAAAATAATAAAAAATVADCTDALGDVLKVKRVLVS
jgi:DNA uptake protein ComE-like DNA-binding protein